MMLITAFFAALLSVSVPAQERYPGKPVTFKIKGKKAERAGKLTPVDSLPVAFLPAYHE